MGLKRFIVVGSVALFALVGCALMKAASGALLGEGADMSTPDAALGSAMGAAAEGLIRSTPIGSMALDAVIAIGGWKVVEAVGTSEGRRRLATMVRPSRGGLKGTAKAVGAIIAGAPDPHEQACLERRIAALQKELDDRRYGVAQPTSAG